MNLYWARDFSLEYFTYGNSNNPPLVLIPPGIGNATHFNQLIESLKDKFYILTFNLPGIGKSQSSTGDLKALAFEIADLLKDLKVIDPIILGESYGGSVAIEIDKLIKVKRLILFGSGEYFNSFIRFIFRLIFAPAVQFRLIRKVYSKILSLTPIFDFKEFKDEQLVTTNQRWLSVLDYKIDQSISKTPIDFYLGSKDIILNKKSLKKIKDNYPKLRFHKLDCNHFEYKKYYLLLDICN